MKKNQVNAVDSSEVSSQGDSLYDQVMNQKPLFNSNAEALASYNNELNELAQKHKLSTADLVQMAYNSIGQYNEEMERALSLNRKIGYLVNLRA